MYVDNEGEIQLKSRLWKKKLRGKDGKGREIQWCCLKNKTRGFSFSVLVRVSWQDFSFAVGFDSSDRFGYLPVLRVNKESHAAHPKRKMKPAQANKPSKIRTIRWEVKEEEKEKRKFKNTDGLVFSAGNSDSFHFGILKSTCVKILCISVLLSTCCFQK